MRTFLEYLIESSVLLENVGVIGHLHAKGYGMIEVINTSHSDMREKRIENIAPVKDEEVIELINYCLNKVLEDLETGKIRYNPDGFKEILIRDHRKERMDLNIVYGLYLGNDKERGQNKIKATTIMRKKDFPSFKNWTRTYDIRKDGIIAIGNWNQSFYPTQ